MIAAWIDWPAAIGVSGDDELRGAMARSLAAYGASISRSTRGQFHGLAATSTHASPGTSIPVLLHGRIDNAPDITRETGVPPGDPAALYAAALAKWGDAADAHLVGNYAAIAMMPGGAVRLARSPWDAPPLFHADDGRRVIASPLLRVLFAGGAPKQLDYDRLADELAFDFRSSDGASWYRGIGAVPLGASVTLQPGGSQRTDKWYDAGAVPEIRRRDERDYVEEARALLEETAGKALDGVQRPAIALSGGLDSPLVADALLRAMPGNAQLQAITFTPDPACDVELPPGIIADELPVVHRFAAMHPRLALHVADPAQGGFDYRARDMFAAMDSFVLGLANVGMYHGVYAKARALGCDAVFNADLGNQSFSDDGRWAYAEYARRGKWGQLAQLLRNRPGDRRPLWRKALALSVLPNLPPAIRTALRGWVHPARRDMTALLSPLSPAALAAHRARAQQRDGHGEGAWDDFSFAQSRQDAARLDHAAADRHASTVTLAFEQLYGLSIRDVTAYRPLIEYCLGLPTEQFAHDGMERRLARRMAEGRMPEAQRLETGHGFHNIDMHARLTRQRGELAAYCTAMRNHKVLGQLLDIDRIERLLADWPARGGLDIEQDWPRIMAIPRAVMAARFIAHAEGRNDL